MKDDALQQHMASTYRNLRWGLATIGFAFPLFLWFVGWLWYGIPLQDSMSAYYHAASPGEGPVRRWLSDTGIFRHLLFFLQDLDGEAPMRSWFVGMLFVLGVLLYLYKGFGDRENYLLNAAGLFALGIALFPMEWNCSNTCRSFTLHGLWALLAFGCIAVVAIFFSKYTLAKLPLAEERTRYYNIRYNITGTLMILFPVLAFLTTLLIGDNAKFIFYAEWFGIWSFAAYWTIKSKELQENRAEKLALDKDPRLNADPVMQTDVSLART